MRTLQYLNADQRDHKLVLVYSRPDAVVGEDPLFELELSRTAMGISFEDGIHVSIVGERTFVHDERSLREQRDQGKGKVLLERMYISLADHHGNLAEEVFAECVNLKDMYRPRTLYSPDTPIYLIESMRLTDGLTHYQTTREFVAEEKWQHFRSFDQRVGLFSEPLPDEATVHRDLEHFHTTAVRDPETSVAKSMGDGTEAMQLAFPTDLGAPTTLAAFRQGQLGPCMALWYAVRGLHNSRPRLEPIKREVREREFVQPGY